MELLSMEKEKGPGGPKKHVPEPIKQILETTYQHKKSAVLKLSPSEGDAEVNEIRRVMEAYGRHTGKGLRFKYDPEAGIIRVGLYDKKKRAKK